MQASIDITLDIVPRGKGRPIFSSKNKTARTPESTRAYENEIKILARRQFKGNPLTQPIQVYVIFEMPRPKTSKRTYPTVKPDCDNLQKSLFDALNEILWVDDSQIVKVEAYKVYGTNGKIKMKVSEY